MGRGQGGQGLGEGRSGSHGEEGGAGVSAESQDELGMGPGLVQSQTSHKLVTN